MPRSKVFSLAISFCNFTFSAFKMFFSLLCHKQSQKWSVTRNTKHGISTYGSLQDSLFLSGYFLSKIRLQLLLVCLDLLLESPDKSGFEFLLWEIQLCLQVTQLGLKLVNLFLVLVILFLSLFIISILLSWVRDCLFFFAFFLLDYILDLSISFLVELGQSGRFLSLVIGAVSLLRGGNFFAWRVLLVI